MSGNDVNGGEPALLAATGLSAGYARPVVGPVSLRLARGEIVGIVGPNGAGKSTLVRAICGLNPVRGGQILKDGRPVHGEPPHRRAARGIAVVLENRRLFGELTVRTNLDLAAGEGDRRAGRDRRFTLDSILALFPFMEARLDAHVELLSGGEQQMVAIGRALMSNPEMLLLDEPSLGLSPLLVKELFAAIGRIRETGMGLLMVEQNARESLRIADRGYVIANGKVSGSRSAVELQSDDSVRRAYLGGLA